MVSHVTLASSEAIAISGTDIPSPPVETIPGDIARGVILLCDHASNEVPADLHDLGLPPEQFERHIGYDIGAAAVTRGVARRLGAPAVLTRFSRLVIDPNRGRDDPTLVMRLSDGAVVPGNAHIDDDGIAERIRRFYDPYDVQVAALIENAIATGIAPVIISVHSFTPVWRGRPRPWQVGLLWDGDDRMASALITALEEDGESDVGRNEPYAGGLPGDTIDRHATSRGLANVLIEIRQDLIALESGADAWAERLARLIEKVITAPALHEIRHFPQRFPGPKQSGL